MEITEKPLPLITRTSKGPEFIGLPPSTFHNAAKNDPTFPKKIRLGPQTTGFLTAELVAWVESKRVEA